MVVQCELKIASLGITVRHHSAYSANLVMPNSYPCDEIFNPHLTTIKDSYILITAKRKHLATCKQKMAFSQVTWPTLIYRPDRPNGPRQANLVLIAYASSEGSGEPAHPRYSLIQAVSQEEPSDRKPDPWPLWMAGHALLKFVMTECSKTQIRWAELKWLYWVALTRQKNSYRIISEVVDNNDKMGQRSFLKRLYYTKASVSMKANWHETTDIASFNLILEKTHQ